MEKIEKKKTSLKYQQNVVILTSKYYEFEYFKILIIKYLFSCVIINWLTTDYDIKLMLWIKSTVYYNVINFYSELSGSSVL